MKGYNNIINVSTELFSMEEACQTVNEEVCATAKAAPVCKTTYEQECSTQMVMEMKSVQEQKCESVPEQVI